MLHTAHTSEQLPVPTVALCALLCSVGGQTRLSIPVGSSVLPRLVARLLPQPVLSFCPCFHRVHSSFCRASIASTPAFVRRVPTRIKVLPVCCCLLSVAFLTRQQIDVHRPLVLRVCATCVASVSCVSRVRVSPVSSVCCPAVRRRFGSASDFGWFLSRSGGCVASRALIPARRPAGSDRLSRATSQEAPAHSLSVNVVATRSATCRHTSVRPASLAPSHFATDTLPPAAPALLSHPSDSTALYLPHCISLAARVHQRCYRFGCAACADSSTMRGCTALLLCVVVAAAGLLVLVPSPVSAAAVCSGDVACAGQSNNLQVNGVTYCCPTSGVNPSATNYADPSTYSCPTTQSCRQCTIHLQKSATRENNSS